VYVAAMSLSSQAYKVISDRRFNDFILGTILVNCFFLAMQDPTGTKTIPGEVYANAIFTVVFFVEMVLKMIALSVHGYFEDYWNWLDFVVVMESIISALLEVISLLPIHFQNNNIANISGLRTLRVFRVLRTINFIPEMKILLDAFFGSWDEMVQLVVFVLAFIVAFANFGRLTFQKTLNKRCVTMLEDFRHYPSTHSKLVFDNQVCGGWNKCHTDPCEAYYQTAILDNHQFLSFPTSRPNCTYEYTVPDGILGGQLRHGCFPGPPENVTLFDCHFDQISCKKVSLPASYRNLNFDSIYPAIYSVFEVFTLGTWEEGMFTIQDAVNPRWWQYYLVMLFFGNILMMNLFPAIISVRLAEALRANQEKKWAELKSQEDAKAGISQERTQFQTILYGFTQVEEEDRKLVQRIRQYRQAKAGEVDEQETLPRFTPNCPGFATARAFVQDESGPFSIFIYGVITANIILLASHSKNQAPVVTTVLEITNKIFEAIFFSEALIKIVLYGPVGYFGDKYNVFDFVISMLGFVDLVAQGKVSLLQFSGLRVLRMLRLAKLVNAMRLRAAVNNRSRLQGSQTMGISRLLKVMSESGYWIVFIYLLLLIMLFIFSVLAMQFFGSTNKEVYFEQVLLDGLTNTTYAVQNPYYGFTNFWVSAISLFIIYTNDRWTTVAFDAIKEAPTNNGMLFFIVWVLLSRYFILSLVISVIFSVVKEDVLEVLKLETLSDVRAVFSLECIFDHMQLKKYFHHWKRTASRAHLSLVNNVPQQAGRLDVELLEVPEQNFWETIAASEQPLLCFDPNGYSCFFCRKLIRSILFELFNQAAVISSTVVVITQADIVAQIRGGVTVGFNTEQRALFRKVDAFAAFVFGMDILLRSIADGFYFLPNAFLKQSWMSYVDSVVTILAVIDVFSPGLPTSPIRLCRIVRIFRPITLRSKSDGIRMLFTSVNNAFRPMLYTICVLIFVLFVFGVIGVQLWSDALKSCQYPGIDSSGKLRPYPPPGTPLTPDNCQDIVTAFFNFDNLFDGMCAAFVIFTLDGWHKVLNSVTASTGVEKEPSSIVFDPLMAIYFIVFILICQAMVIYFIGTVYSSFLYGAFKKELGRASSLKESSWGLYRQQLRQIKPMIEPSPPKKERVIANKVYKMLAHRYYKIFITIMVVTNLIIAYGYGASFTTPQPQWIAQVDEMFRFFYVFEWILRFYIYDLKEMLNPRELRCWIDITVHAICVINATRIPHPGLKYPPYAVNHLYTPLAKISAIRATRLFIIHNSLMELAYTVMRSLPPVLYVFLLLVIITVAFATVAVFLYGGRLNWLFLNSDQSDCINAIDLSQCNDMYSRHLNLDDVRTAMVTMFVMMTGDHFNDLLWGIWEQHEGKLQRFLDIMFFVTFCVMSRFVLLNLFMMTILFEYNIHSPDQIGIAKDLVEQFRYAWRDSNGSGNTTMAKNTTMVCKFLRELGEPLGVHKTTSALETKWYATKVLEEIDDVRQRENITTASKPKKSGIWKWLDRKKAAAKKRKKETVNTTEEEKAEETEDFETVKNRNTKASKATHEEEEEVDLDGDGVADSVMNAPLRFEEVIIALHKMAILGVRGAESFFMNEERQIAKQNITMLKMTAMRIHHGNNNDALRDLSMTRRIMPGIYYKRFIDALHRYVLHFLREVEVTQYVQSVAVEAELLCKLISREQAIIAKQMTLMNRIVTKELIGNIKYKTKLEILRSYLTTIRMVENLLLDLRKDHEMSMWNPASLQVKDNSVRHPKYKGCTAMCATEDGTYVVIGHNDNTAKVYKITRLYQVTQQAPCFQLEQTLKLADVALSFVFSPDSKRLFCGLASWLIQPFADEARHSNKKKKKKQKQNQKQLVPAAEMKGHRGAVHALRTCDQFLFSAGADGFVLMWRFRSLEPILRLNISGGQFGVGASQLFAMIVYTHEPLLSDNPPSFVFAGGETAAIYAAPIITSQSFLMAGKWDYQKKVPVFPDPKAQIQEVVTAMALCWGLLYVGGSKGRVQVLQMFVDSTSKDPRMFHLIALQSFAVHSNAISCMVFQSGVLFTGSHDLSIVPWKEPSIQRAKPADLARTVKNLDIPETGEKPPDTSFAATFQLQLKTTFTFQGDQSLTSEQKEEIKANRIERITQKWESGFVGHVDALTCMCSMSKNERRGADLLISGDSTGLCLAQGPTKKHTFISETSLHRLTPIIQQKNIRS